METLNRTINKAMDSIEPPETPDPLKAAVKILFGLDYLFPYQRLVISNILEAAEARGLSVQWPFGQAGTGRENPGQESDRESMGRQIVILPTGAGKSLCFQLPAMLLSGPTLVIYPILSLMADQERSLREKGFDPVLLRGGQSIEERDLIWEKIFSGKSRFIIANPEVLLTPQVMKRLPALGLVHLVIDEAHCVSEWGESFRPDYLRIGEIYNALCGSGPGPMVTAFTATASAMILEKIQTYIFAADTQVRRVVGNPDRSNISYSGSGVLLRDLAVRDFLTVYERPAVVFCSSRPGVEKLARYLRNSLDDREIRFYHAGLSREEKTAVEKWFFPNPGAVLVSTCAYGMGVDKPDIRTVIHRDCPPSVEAYLQESGRAGRDGKDSRAILLWGPDDARRLAASGAGKKRLEDLMRYARDTRICRREALLNLLDYEGPRDSPEKACCDVCEKKARPELREESVLCGFFRRNNRSYLVNEAARILAAARNIRWSESEAAEAINFLIKTGKLKEMKNPLWKGKLCLSKTGRQSVLR